MYIFIDGWTKKKITQFLNLCVLLGSSLTQIDGT